MDGDFLQLRVGEGGVVVDGSLDELFEALGRYRHGYQCRLLAAGVPPPWGAPRRRRGYPCARPDMGAFFRGCRDVALMVDFSAASSPRLPRGVVCHGQGSASDEQEPGSWRRVSPVPGQVVEESEWGPRRS